MSCENKINDFYTDQNLNKLKKKCGIKPVTMNGAVDILIKLKEWIKEEYGEVSYLDYDIGFHGWSGEAAKNLHNLREQLTIKVEELYAICLAGLDEEPEKGDKIEVY